MPRTPPLAQIDSRMPAADNVSNTVGDALPAGVTGDVFGLGNDDENKDAFINIISCVFALFETARRG